MRSFLIVLLSLAALGLFATAGYFYVQDRKADDAKQATNESSTSGSEPQLAPGISADPPFAVKASTISRDYASNEVAADAKYLKHRVVLDGTIDRIWKMQGRDTIEFIGHNDFAEVECVVAPDADHDVLLDLKKGERITADGVVFGYDRLNGVVVGGCGVESVWK